MAGVLPKKEESGVLMVMNLPDSLTDEHVRELLSPFGELKRFNLLKVNLKPWETKVPSHSCVQVSMKLGCHVRLG